MDGSGGPTDLPAQQAAIQEARAHYERGELTFDAFRRALDALVLARDADECQAILDALPVSPMTALSSLGASPIPAPTAAPPPEHKWVVAFMSQIKKLRRPWQLAATTRAVAFMGEIKLDLRLAELPPQARLHVTAIMGSVTIYVPRSMRVAVHTAVFMGDTRAFGESIGGMVVFGHDEHVPTAGTSSAQLDIEVLSVMSSVKIVLTDGKPAVSIGELVREALRAIADGAQRGLRQRADRYPELDDASTRNLGQHLDV
jgi:Cell wall-active antibiotics response 4TMS YvqF